MENSINIKDLREFIDDFPKGNYRGGEIKVNEHPFLADDKILYVEGQDDIWVGNLNKLILHMPGDFMEKVDKCLAIAQQRLYSRIEQSVEEALKANKLPPKVVLHHTADRPSWAPPPKEGPKPKGGGGADTGLVISLELLFAIIAVLVGIILAFLYYILK